VGFGLVLFAVAEWVVHSGVNQRGRAYIVAQVLLGGIDAAVGFGLTIPQIVVVGVVSKRSFMNLHVITV